MTKLNTSSMKKHKLSLFSSVVLCCTSMVGSGWLFSAQLVAQRAGNYAFLAWILAALFIISIALCLSHVITLHPYRGANARITSISHNAAFGIPFAFSAWFGIAVVIATEAQASTQYLAPFMGNMIMQDNKLTELGKALGVAFVCLYLLINWYGLKLLSKVNNIITVLKIFTPLFVITILIVSYTSADNLTQVNTHQYTLQDLFPAIVTSGIIYSFNGFQIITSFASEIDNPKKNIRLSIIISIIIILVFYLLLQYSFMTSMPTDKLTHGWAGVNMASPIVGLTMALGLHFLTLLLLIDSIVTPSSVGYSFLSSASRMLYGMSKEKQAPYFLSRHIHPTKNISIPAIMTNFFIAIIFLLQADNWSELMITVTMLHLIGYMGAPISMATISPKTKIYTLGVFTAISSLMYILPDKDILLGSTLLSLLSATYIIIQGKKQLKESVLFSSPFIIFLWLLYFNQPLWGHLLITIIFFTFVTHPSYVMLCKQYQKPPSSDLI
ncbi:APC family permease [uncultured Shewanella sp.]|uniref:APC family permease n=1 Tax=uncultured Shewanella sp. TaxID=173975 RepID=UPI00260429F6|nr:APC family permease [uncultured Shewanella sp.]